MLKKPLVGLLNSLNLDPELDFMEYSTPALAQAAYVTNAMATGGIITTDGLYTVHKFISSGTFTPAVAMNVEILVVAGGGAGGGSTADAGYAGGGGAGGLVEHAAKEVTAQAYTVTVGAGGTGGNGTGGSGEDSVFGDITAVGGGGGGTHGSNGVNGGSGGGGASPTKAGGATTQGNSGGGTGYGYAGTNGREDNQAGGGGGGAGATSADRTGGTGRQNDILVAGSNVYYAGGGGGAPAGGTGGLGGGGNSASAGTTGGAGTANTGGGGGGTGYVTGVGGAGGSGIVIVRYLTVLQCFSEDTIKTQGDHSLRIQASTDSLNRTIIRSISPPIDCSGMNKWKTDVRALRIGSNFKITLHNDNAATIVNTPNLAEVSTFQTEDIDISAVADSNKDAIDEIKIEILDAAAPNTIYIDNMFAIFEDLTAPYRAQKGLISGYHCFIKQYLDFTKLGLAPLKLPDGTKW